MNIYLKPFFILIVWLCAIPAYSYNLRQISNLDGLSNSAVTSLHQDKDGLLWLGTCDGLNLYDGIEIRRPVFRGSNHLSGNMIEDIIETQKNILWVQTNHGLDKIDTHSMRIASYTQFQGKCILRTTSQGELYILTKDNILYTYNNKNQTFETIHIPSEEEVYTNLFIRRKQLFLCYEGGVKVFDIISHHDTQVKTVKYNRTYHEQVTAAFEGNDEYIYWIDGKLDLYRFSSDMTNKQHLLSLSDVIQQRGQISDIALKGENIYIAFKTNGVIRCSIQQPNSVREDLDIKTGVFKLLNDSHQDILWIGSDGQGVFQFSQGPYSFRSVTFDDLRIDAAKPVRAIFWDRENGLWIGTKGEGIIKIPHFFPYQTASNLGIQTMNKQNSQLSDNSVYAFAPSSHDVIWIGNEEGIDYYSYNEKCIKHVEVDDEIKYVHAIYEDPDSILWLATVGTGIVKARVEWKGHTPSLTVLKRYLLGNGVSSANYFFTMSQGEDGGLYFGNRGYGTFRIVNDNIESITLKNNYQDKTAGDVFSIIADRETLWLGTGYGLIKQTLTNEQCIMKSTERQNCTVHAMLKDDSDNIWISTNGGLIRHNIRNQSLQIYNGQNGLNVIEYSDGASFRGNGWLFFGGINGFVMIHEDTTYQESSQYIPSIKLARLDIQGKSENPNQFITEEKNSIKKLTLDYAQNNFSISFIAIDYLNANNYSYLYRINNTKGGWTDNGADNTISFTGMQSGEYQLQVKCLNHTTGNESEIFELSVCITPPWYLSTAAKGMYLLIGMAIIAGAVYMYIQRQRRKQETMMMLLEQAHKDELFEEKLRFFTNITHELCTPLTLIFGPCEHILDYVQSDSYIKKYALIIKKTQRR